MWNIDLQQKLNFSVCVRERESAWGRGSLSILAENNVMVTNMTSYTDINMWMGSQQRFLILFALHLLLQIFVTKVFYTISMSLSSSVPMLHLLD